MSLPTLEQYLTSAAKWRRTHKGVGYTLSHHGVSNYSPQGTWCFYIHLLEGQFQRPEDFARFDRESVVRETFPGSFWQSYDYFDVPDYGFHGGITYYDRTTYIDKTTGEPRKALEIGCDYVHAFDRDRGYYEGLEDVARDAIRLIDKLVEAVPLKDRCAYSGRYDMPDQFYTAVNGARVHVSQEAKASEGSPNWGRPASPDGAA